MNEQIEEIIAGAYELFDQVESLLLSISQRLAALDQRVRAVEQRIDAAGSSSADVGGENKNE